MDKKHGKKRNLLTFELKVFKSIVREVLVTVKLWEAVLQLPNTLYERKLVCDDIMIEAVSLLSRLTAEMDELIMLRSRSDNYQ